MLTFVRYFRYFLLRCPGAALAVGVVAASCCRARGDVLAASQIAFTAAVPPWGGQYSTTIEKTPTVGGVYTVAGFEYGGMTLAVNGTTVDEESDWYLVGAGDVLSADAIDGGRFPVLYTTDHYRPPVAIPLGDFYLGVNTGLGYTAGKPNRDAFGWLELNNTGTELIAVGNAVDYGDGGIIVGTTTPAPEPASLLLLAGGLGLLAIRRRGR